MATATSSNAPYNGTLASFKQWAQAISNALSAFGWIQTADTGQVNWSTISAVPGINSTVYEVWKSADSISSTLPMYLLMQYGSINPIAAPQLYITVGTGSTGSGQITTPSITIDLGPASYTATSYSCYFSGATNRFQMAMYRASGINVPGIFSIERAHDVNGNDLGTYFTCVYVSFATINQQTFYPAGGGWLPIEPNLVSVQTVQTSSSYLSNVLAAPIFPVVSGLGNPLLGAMVVKIADVTDGTSFTTTVYGATHTFMALTTMNASTAGRSGSNNAIAMRYE